MPSTIPPPAAVDRIAPDRAVCPACLRDMHSQSHRVAFPFTGCNACGPRFSIVTSLPGARIDTTMRSFTMCDRCAGEAADVNGRRFGDPAIACNQCGPYYTLYAGNRTVTELPAILDLTARLLVNGAVVAIKGMGGFHLACSAFDEDAIRALRSRRRQDGRPLALMFSSIEALRRFARVSDSERQALESPEAPIVVLKTHTRLSPLIQRGLDTVGAMLPHTPFHHMLFEELGIAGLVMASANISGNPALYDNDIARLAVDNIADAIVTYNRDISRPVDDSIVFVANEMPRMLRRARGFVPDPIAVTQDCSGIFAAGVDRMNCFALGRGYEAILSRHIGDLHTPGMRAHFEESVDHFSALFDHEPSLLAVDMDPADPATRYCRQKGLPLVQVQHHHAHIASCLAENGVDEKVIGICFDNGSRGEDGTIWGGEVLICDLESFTRAMHLRPLPQPGGISAVEEPWRMAVSYLHAAFGPDFRSLPLPWLRVTKPNALEMTQSAIENRLNAPLTTSAQRLIEAVSALCGICSVNSWDGEAAAKLECAMGRNGCDLPYPYEIIDSIDTIPMIQAIVEDLIRETDVSHIAHRVHETMVRIIVDTALMMRSKHGIETVALSGGTFRNRFLLERVERDLAAEGLRVLANRRVPSDDGGIALGQIAVAARRRATGCAIAGRR